MSTFEEAFEQTGHGVFNHVVLLTCGLVLLYAMMESLGIGYVITAAECELHLTPNQKGMINAAAFIGIVATAIFWGYLSDHYGRRSVMLPAIAAGTVVSVGSSLSNTFGLLFVLRFLTGCLVSASSATVYAYLGEMHIDSRRSPAIAYGSTFIAFTFIIMSVLAWIILSGNWSFSFGGIQIVPWRVFVWSWSTPGLLASAIMMFLPESPRYLYSAKGQAKALPVLAKIYAWNHRNKTVEDYPIKSIQIVSAQSAQRGFCKAFSNMRQLARAPLRRCVLISHFSMFMVFMLSSGLYTWMPFILNEMLNHATVSSNMCDILAGRYKDAHVHHQDPKLHFCKAKKMNPLVFPVSTAMGAICATTYIVIGCVIPKCNKITIYCTILVVGSLMLAVSSFIAQPIVAIVLFVAGLASGCAGSVLAAIAVDVFPTSVRALALCTLYMSGRTGAAVGANLVGMGIQHHCSTVLFFNTLGTAGSTLLMLLWPDPKAVRSTMEGRGFAY